MNFISIQKKKKKIQQFCIEFPIIQSIPINSFIGHNPFNFDQNENENGYSFYICVCVSVKSQSKTSE